MIKEVKEMQQVFNEDQMDMFNKVDQLAVLKAYSEEEASVIASQRKYKFEPLHPHAGHANYPAMPVSGLPENMAISLLMQGTIPMKRWKNGQILGVIGYLSLVF